MIECHLKDYYQEHCPILIPHEINNEFLGIAGTMARNGKIPGVKDIESFSDFGDVQIGLDRIDEFITNWRILEKKLNTITQVIPLPKYIGKFDGHYTEGFLSPRPRGVEELKKWLDNYKEGIYTPVLEREFYPQIDGYREFTKEDMLLLILLIKKKAVEAKEKRQILCFSGD